MESTPDKTVDQGLILDRKEPPTTDCPDCEGRGLISCMDKHGVSVTRECPRCHGIGEIYL